MAYTEEMTTSEILLRLASMRNELLQAVNDIEKISKNICYKAEQTEPQTNADQHVQRVEYVGNDEKSRCWTCKHFERMHETPISSDGSYYTYVVCTASECRYEPKTEPTISKMEQVDKDINVRSKTEPQTFKGLACDDDGTLEVEDEPQTETEAD